MKTVTIKWVMKMWPKVNNEANEITDKRLHLELLKGVLPGDLIGHHKCFIRRVWSKRVLQLQPSKQ